MQKNIKKYLLLEQLEERIFLDANPIAAVEPLDPIADPTVVLIPINPPQVEPQDSVAGEPEPTSENSEQETTSEPDEPEDASSNTAATVQEEGGDGAQSVSSEDISESTLPSSDEVADNDHTTLAEPATDTQLTEVEVAEESSSPVQIETEAGDASGLDETAEMPPVDAIDPMIGEDFTFTATLDNTTGGTLYGPYIDIYMPTSGDDGDDGASFVDASYLGTPVSATVQTFDATGEILHPYAVDGAGNPITISGTEGDTYVTLEMPFGSFTPDQPAADVEITAHISENRQVDEAGGSTQDFNIQVYNGYRYGSNPLDDPDTDPPVDPTLVSTQSYRPEVIRFEKVYLGEEQETATGPNYPRQYQITIDIADGQTISNLELTEHLPDEIYYMGDSTVSVSGGGPFSVTSPNSAGGIFTDGILTVALTNSITGSDAADDVVVTFDFYVPQYYTDGVTPILLPATGDDADGNEDREVVNDVQVEGDWTPIDLRDRPSDGSPIHIVMDAEVDSEGIISLTPGIDEVFDAEAIAIQKTVGLADGYDTGIIGGYNPDDIVQYTLTFQVSDYFNLGDIQINDVLPDGLELLEFNNPINLSDTKDYTPTFSIQDETDSWSGNWSIGSNLTTLTQAGDDTRLTFDVSAAIIAAGGPDGILQGDLYGNTDLDNPATGTITYYALIKDEYVSTGDSSGPGDISVDQGDLFTNDVTIEGQIYGDDGTGTGTLTSTGFDLDQDDSSASFQIEVGQVDKEMYAINGNTDLSSFTDAQGNIHVQPDDTVTYRLQYYMPTSEFESFRLDDYLPLPVFDASEITTFDDGDPDIPIAGHWDLHPDDTYSDAFPLEPITLQTNVANGENRVSFIYDEHDDTTAQETWIDILFTVTVSDDPFVDGLYLTNQVRGTEDGTPLVPSNTDAIIQIVLDEPVLEITKGIVQSDNDADVYNGNAAVSVYFTEPGNNTGINGSRLEQTVSSSWLDLNSLDTDVSGLDAGDTVTVAIVLENIGNSDTYDVTVTDVLPLGYMYVASSLQVTNGAGDSLTYSGNVDVDLFGAGLIIDDTVDDGSLEGHDDTSGTNIMVITYDLLLQDSVGPNQTLLNTASITNYGGNEGAGNHVQGTLSDDATTQITDVVVEKSIASTSQAHTLGSDVAIGETVTYSVTITLPEGSATGVTFTDVLDPDNGLEIESLDTLSADPSLLSISSSGDISTINDAFLLAHGTIAADGLSFIVDFDDIENSDRNNAVSETITLTYTALVRNIANNQSTVDLDNTARWDWTDGNGTDQNSSDSQTVTVVEPDLVVSKSVDNPTPDEDDTVTFTITVQHGPSSDADAFDVVLNDTIPSGYENVTITGQTGTAVTVSGNTLSGSWDVFGAGESYTITLTADLVVDPQAGQTLSNTATIDWTSLPEDGDPYERTGTPAGGDPDDYITSATVAVTVGGTIDKVDPNPSSYTIGDEVQYYILVTLPEGNTNNLIVTDDLPAGMQYVADSHTLYTTSGASDPSGLLTQDFSGSSITLTSPPAGGTSNGMPVSFSYGDIAITADNDPSGENDAFVIGLRALVLNDSGNHDDPDGGGALQATALTNDTYMVYDNPAGGSPITVNDPIDPIVTVIEPWISTIKTVDQTTGVEAGDLLTYTVALANNGNATAYEVNFNDTLAPGTSIGVDPIQSVTRSDGIAVSTGTAVTQADSSILFSADDWDLDPGETLTLTYTVTVSSAALVDGTHTNSVDADWSSQDGSDPDERVYDEDDSDGIDSPVDDDPNADRDVDDAVFSMEGVTIAKSDGGVTAATIGDTITYTLTINAPQGTIDNFAVEDILAQGLIFNDDATITTTNGTFSIETGFSQDPGFTLNDGSAPVTISWTLGDTEILTDDPLIISYTATVADISTNFLGETLGNTASIAYDNAQGIPVTPDPVEDGFTVSEPQITTEKIVVDSDDAGTDAQWNETLTYTARFTNSGDSTAYEVNALDTLAPGTQFDALSSTVSSFGAVADPTMTDNGDGTVSIAGDWDIPVGEYVEIEYTVTVLGAVFLAPPHENTVDADWSSQDGVDPHDRQYDDTGTSPVDGDLDTDNAVFTVITTSSIGDTVFFDTDQSSSETPGDTGITDILVTLTADTDGDGTPDFTWTDVTDENGYYSFENLPAFDNYTVTVDPVNLPDDTEATYDLDGIDTEHVISGIVLGVAEGREDVDFGYFNSGTGSIGDTVWYDADADGVLDAGEQGLGGVQLTLTGDITGDDVSDISFTTTTDENGNYTFGDLLPGDYTVTVDSTPAGMEQTFDLDGLVATPGAASLSLADGENNNNVDFGYTGAASIGDTIYFDADNTGSETPGDAGIPGVTVTLTGDVNNDGIEDTLTTVTDEDGTYLFENLPDGAFTIVVDPAGLPAGMNPTADPDGGDDNTSVATVVGGVDDLDQDFGYTGTGIIGDTIWEDTNGDGTQDVGEGGIAGVDVTLSVDFDGDGTADYTGTATTDGNGNYSFDNLPAGTYTIAVDTGSTALDQYFLTGDPDSNPDSASTVNLPAGGTNLDQDFGYQDSGAPTGSIGDTIYFDADGNSSQTGDEPGISGVTVTLGGDVDGDGTPDTVTTTTDINGNYLFDNLLAGDYTITVNPATLPAGMSQTADPDGGNDNTSFVALSAGQNNDLQDFGYNGTGSIGDTIFFDANNNGSQESNEGGINGVGVNLSLDLNGDGIIDYTDSATTDSNGNYLFEELPAGEYTISVATSTLPAGMIQSSDPDSSLDDMAAYSLAGGENNLNQDFGYTGTGSIGDTIWNDADGDGAQGVGETGLPGIDISIEADIDGDGITDYTETTTTDSSGNYLFNNLPAGGYTITVDPATLPTGFSQSGDPDGTNDNSTFLPLGADENNLDQDFGYNSGTGSIGDTIFFDVNGNGTQDGAESGLLGVTVSLTGDVDGDGAPDSVTTTTDSSGAYLFDGLPAGIYTITVDPTTLPAGMIQTADPDGVNNNSSDVALAADEDRLDQDFGYQGTGSIGDTIWDDANDNGILDGTESALPGPGVDVTLLADFDGNGSVDYTQTVTTDPSTGNYLFDNLPAGDYTISVDTNDIAGGYVLTADPDGNPDSTTDLTLAAGENNLDQDFGYSDSSGNPTGSIGDTIYFDENNNGTQDGSDVGLPGATVTLVGDIDGNGSTDSVSTATDVNGNYLFDNLPAGDYTVTVNPATLPAGMSQTDDPDGVSDNSSIVTLGPGVDNDAQDFGYTGSSVIGDTIYFDTNGNGVQDSSENGLPGIDVSISVDFDGDGTPDYTATETTDDNGNYSFDNLPAGDYTLIIETASLPGDVGPSGDPDSTLDNTTSVILGPNEINNDQDFGYTGTGSIGDTVYYDADGNGFQSPGERGLGGVTVTLQGDFDNDGTIEAVTTTTDGNGSYLFDNLTDGVYTVYVDTTTLPGGLTQTGDPDATLDNQSTVALSAGEANLSQDFGYSGPSPFPPALPPQPGIPVIPVTPTSPQPSPVPIAPADQGLVADAFFMYRQFGERFDTEIFYQEEMLPWQPPILPVSPVYTGHTEPGTTIQLVLFDALGNQIGYESVMADTAGNWMADFPETIMYELPHRMEIVQTISSYNVSSAGFFNMRTYFTPSFSSMVYAHTRLDVEAVFAYMPSTVIDSVHHSNLSPFDITWNDFNGYEFIAPSTNPAQDSH